MADEELTPAQQVADEILRTCVTLDFPPLGDEASIEALMGEGLEVVAAMDMDKAGALIDDYARKIATSPIQRLHGRGGRS